VVQTVVPGAVPALVEFHPEAQALAAATSPKTGRRVWTDFIIAVVKNDCSVVETKVYLRGQDERRVLLYGALDNEGGWTMCMKEEEAEAEEEEGRGRNI
jgi:hypothetical protein